MSNLPGLLQLEVPPLNRHRETTLRLGLVAAGALALRVSHSLMLGEAPLINESSFVFLLVISGGIGLGLWVLAGLRHVPQATVWFVLLICLLDVVVRFQVAQATVGNPFMVQSAATAKTDFAVRLLAKGQNPYSWDYTGIYTLYSQDSPAIITPPDRYSFPALGILLALPLHLLGLPPIPMLSTLAYLVLLVAVFWAANDLIRPLVLIPFFAADTLLLSQVIVTGAADLLWAVAFAFCALFWRRHTWRAIVLGMALALHPVAWLILPVLLLRSYLEDGLRAVRHLGTLALAVFLLFNLPFILWDSAAWLAGMVDIAGIAVPAYYLRTIGSLPFFRYDYALLMAIAAWIVLIWLYWRHFNQLRDLCWLLPAAVATLSPYARTELWLFSTLPVVAAWLSLNPARPLGRGSKYQTSLVVSVGVLSVVLMAGMSAFRAHPVLSLEPVYPVFTDSNGRINEITIRLHNRHHPEVAPNFYLQPRFEGEPSRWRIIEGPQRVASGERVNFTIGPVSESGGFYVGARIIVLDPTGHFLGSLVLGDYQDYSFPDNVFNSRFHLWTRGASAPDGWRFDAAPRNRGGAFMTMVDEKSAIALQIEPSDGPTLSALQSTISFPYRPFDLLVKHNGLPDSATFGVEFSDGIHRIVFDFAASVPDIHMAANNFREQRPVPAGTWSVETIDLTAVYAAAGWELPELKYTVYRELELDWRLLDMRLLLASRTSQPVVGYFGGIRQPLERIAPGLLISESLEDRLSTFRRIAAIHRMMRNDHLALITLEGALLQFPHNTELLAEVESLRDTITRSTSQEIP